MSATKIHIYFCSLLFFSVLGEAGLPRKKSWKEVWRGLTGVVGEVGEAISISSRFTFGTVFSEEILVGKETSGSSSLGIPLEPLNGAGDEPKAAADHPL